MLPRDALREGSHMLDWPNISVLVVDEAPDLGTAIVRLLRVIGVGNAEFAKSGEAAHEACSEQHFDVAFVDLPFEAVDRGIALAASLRTASRDLAVVFMSASPRPRTLASDALCLLKPFESGNLRAAMMRALSR
jgi:CheY-like chemotaxis protein